MMTAEEQVALDVLEDNLSSPSFQLWALTVLELERTPTSWPNYDYRVKHSRSRSGRMGAMWSYSRTHSREQEDSRSGTATGLNWCSWSSTRSGSL